jgi:hypothetical protein
MGLEKNYSIEKGLKLKFQIFHFFFSLDYCCGIEKKNKTRKIKDPLVLNQNVTNTIFFVIHLLVLIKVVRKYQPNNFGKD